MNSASRTNGVLVFLLISFGVTWAWEFTARLLLGLSLVSPLVQPPVAFVPAIAAVIVRRWVTREGFGDAGLALRLRAGWRYYLAAWMLPWAFVAVAVGLAAATGLAAPVWSRLGESALPPWAVLLLLVAGVPLLAPVYWGEEFGCGGAVALLLLVRSAGDRARRSSATSNGPLGWRCITRRPAPKSPSRLPCPAAAGASRRPICRSVPASGWCCLGLSLAGY